MKAYRWIRDYGFTHSWSASCPACVTPTKVPQYLSGGRLVGLRSWSGHFGEDDTLFLMGFEPWIVVAIDSHCTDYTTLAHHYCFLYVKK
jgi:hypothetical protein